MGPFLVYVQKCNIIQENPLKVKYKHKVVRDGELYRVLYPDMVLSQDSYNLTRAKEHARKLTEDARQNAVESNREAH